MSGPALLRVCKAVTSETPHLTYNPALRVIRGRRTGTVICNRIRRTSVPCLVVGPGRPLPGIGCADVSQLGQKQPLEPASCVQGRFGSLRPGSGPGGRPSRSAMRRPNRSGNLRRKRTRERVCGCLLFVLAADHPGPVYPLCDADSTFTSAFKSRSKRSKALL